MGILGFIIVGLIAGLIARAVVPGDDSMGIIATIVLGMIGSFVGGFLGSLFSKDALSITSSGVLGSVIGAIVVLIAYNMVSKRKA